MAQFFTDFSEHALGQAPSDWTVRWGSLPRTIASGQILPSSDRHLSLGINNPGVSYVRNAVSWDAPGVGGAGTTLYAVMRLVMTTATAGDIATYRQFGMPVIGGGGTIDSRAGYFAFTRAAPNITISEAVGGSEVAVATDSSPNSIFGVGGFLSHLEVCHELRWLEGGVIELRVWLYGDPRPEAPLLTYADSSPRSPGWVGLGHLTGPSAPPLLVYAVGVGTNGDPAPMSPLGPGTTPVVANTSLRWALRERTWREVNLSWAIRRAIASDASLRWQILQGVGSDAALAWSVRERVAADADLRWQLLRRLQSDSALRWAVREQVMAYLDLRWTIESALGRVTSDLSLRWAIVQRIAASLAALWDVRETAAADADLRWSILSQIAADLSARWDVLQRIERGETLRWEVLARTASDLTLRWRIESNNSFPDLAGTITITSATPRISLASATPVISIH